MAKSKQSNAPGSSTVQPGGAATTSGVWYQMLATLLEIADSAEIRGIPADSGITWILEPANGGDFVAHGNRRTVFQAKMRSTSQNWTVAQVFKHVLPDLLKAADSSIESRYVFVTDGRFGNFEALDKLAEVLGDSSTLALHSVDEIWRTAVINLKNKRLREVEKSLLRSANDYLNEILNFLIGKKEPGDSPLDQAELRRRVVEVLKNFERKRISTDGLRRQIGEHLMNLGITRERLINQVDELVGRLHRLGGKGNVTIRRSDVFRKDSLPLYWWSALRDRNRSLMRESLRSARYDYRRDVRSADIVGCHLRASLALDSAFFAVAGECGVGKTWALFRAINEAESADYFSFYFKQASQSLDQDLDRVAKQFCEEIWKIDSVFTFNVLAGKILASEAAPRDSPWMVLFLDGPTTADYFTESDFDRLRTKGVGLVMIANQSIDTAQRITIPRFSQREVLEFLTRYRITLPPLDVLDLIRLPILAELYRDVSTAGAWIPTNEYELVNRHWAKFRRMQTPAIQALEVLASKVIERDFYPWRQSSLLNSGISEASIRAIVASGLLIEQNSRLDLAVWHDRILAWAMAEGLVQRWRMSEVEPDKLNVESLVALVSKASSPEDGRRFGYVRTDVLWLLLEEAGPANREAALEIAKTAVGPGLVIPKGYLESLGDRIVPILKQWVESLPAEDPYTQMYCRSLGEVAAKIRSKVTRREAIQALAGREGPAWIFALEILLRQPDPAALRALWAIGVREVRKRQANSEQGHKSGATPIYLEPEKFKKALRSCLSLDQEFAKRVSLESDNANLELLLDSLIFLPYGLDLWFQYKDNFLIRAIGYPAMEKAVGRCLIYFPDQDSGIFFWLEERANVVDEDGIAPLGAIARTALWCRFEKWLSLPSNRGELDVPPEVEAFRFCLLSFWWLTRLAVDDEDAYRMALAEYLQRAGFAYGVRNHGLGLFRAGPALIRKAHEEILQCLEGQTASIGRGSQAKNRRIEDLFARIGAEELSAIWEPFCLALDRALADWVILHPREIDKRSCGEVGEALLLLGRLAGEGMEKVADHFLDRCGNWNVALHILPFLERSCPPWAATRLAAMISLPATTEEMVHAQVWSLMILAHHGYWDEALPGIMALGTKYRVTTGSPASEHPWPPEAVARVVDLLNRDPTPGALIALGLTGRPDLAQLLFRVMEARSDEPDMLEAGWQALNSLADDSPEFRNFVASSSTARRYRGGQVLMARFGFRDRQQSTLETLLRDLSLDGENETTARQYLSSFATWRPGRVPGTRQELMEHLWSKAFSSRREHFDSSRADAIELLGIFDREAARIACLDALNTDDLPGERRAIPVMLLASDQSAAIAAFRELLLTEEDLTVILAIGEALADHDCTQVLCQWMGDPDVFLREASCFAAQAFPWSSLLEEHLRKARKDQCWRVSDAADEGLQQLLFNREVDRLRELMSKQSTLARKWAALDAAIDLGFPGVSGWLPRWLLDFTNELPSLVQDRAAKAVTTRSRAYVEKLLKWRNPRIRPIAPGD